MKLLALVALLSAASALSTIVHPNYKPEKQTKKAESPKLPEAWMSNKNVMKYNVDKDKRGIENPSISKSVEESRTINRKDMVALEKVHPNFKPQKEPKKAESPKLPEAWMSNKNVMKYNVDKDKRG